MTVAAVTVVAAEEVVEAGGAAEAVVEAVVVDHGSLDGSGRGRRHYAVKK